ncbi:hypothetical protein [Flavobacterium sp. CGRL2]
MRKKAAKENKNKPKELKEVSKDSIKKNIPKINIDSIKMAQRKNRRQL